MLLCCDCVPFDFQSQALAVYMSPLQILHIHIMKHAHIQCLDTLIESRLNALSHQTRTTLTAEIVLHPSLAKRIFLSRVSTVLPLYLRSPRASRLT
jgi:hypothetical protein